MSAQPEHIRRIPAPIPQHMIARQLRIPPGAWEHPLVDVPANDIMSSDFEDRAVTKAVIMFSSREKAQAYIDPAPEPGWKPMRLSFSALAIWLEKSLPESKYVIVDLERRSSESSFCTAFEIREILPLLKAADDDNPDPIEGPSVLLNLARIRNLD